MITWNPKLCEHCNKRAASHIEYNYSSPGPDSYTCDNCTFACCDDQCCGIFEWYIPDAENIHVDILQRMREMKEENE